MRSLIILDHEQLTAAFCNELINCGNRKHCMNLMFVGAHLGRITSDELYQLTFDGKFNFSNPT